MNKPPTGDPTPANPRPGPSTAPRTTTSPDLPTDTSAAPRTGPSADLRTGASADPPTGASADPPTGASAALRTGTPVDPRTGASADLPTGASVAPRTAASVDPRTGASADLRIVVADDHGIVREGLGALLSAHAGFELVGTAATGAEAVRSAVTLRPDVLVMDIQMPDLGGIEATREIAKLAPEVAVLMLTMFDDDESVFAAMRAGARGYVLKGAAPDNVIRAITAVAAGEAIFGPGIARRALTYLSGPRPDQPAFPQLTPREREVLALIATGLGNAAIAHRLSLAPATVGNHITNIFAKLQVATRPEAIIRARTAGLGDP